MHASYPPTGPYPYMVNRSIDTQTRMEDLLILTPNLGDELPDKRNPRSYLVQPTRGIRDEARVLHPGPQVWETSRDLLLCEATLRASQKTSMMCGVEEMNEGLGGPWTSNSGR